MPAFAAVYGTALLVHVFKARIQLSFSSIFFHKLQLDKGASV